jgi:hypothetical protein
MTSTKINNNIDTKIYGKFYDKLHIFCNKAVVKSHITSKHEMINIIENYDKIIDIFKEYINNCWSSYHKKTDKKIIKSIDKLLKYKIITDVSCLFSLIIDYCFNFLFKYLQLLSQDIRFINLINKIKDSNEYKKILTYYLTDISKYSIKIFIKEKKDISCDKNCVIYCYKSGDNFCL